MSLVEKALKKMQQSPTAAAADPPPVVAAMAKVQVTSAQAPVQVAHEPVVAPVRTLRIDEEALRAVGLMPPPVEEREIANQYRRIKRPLIARALGKGGERVANANVIMVASALPGEGKTFTSINLALSMAREKDVSVLLVDADVAKPHITRLLGQTGQLGLLEALKDPAIDLESLVVGTNVPNLFVLPAGTPTEHATELLASARMQEIMERLMNRDTSRIVILDSPPLLATTESQAVSMVAGQIVVVVKANRTPQQAVIEGLGHLNKRASVSIVLNEVPEASEGFYYYYGTYGDSANPAGTPAGP